MISVKVDQLRLVLLWLTTRILWRNTRSRCLSTRNTIPRLHGARWGLLVKRRLAHVLLLHGWLLLLLLLLSGMLWRCVRVHLVSLRHRWLTRRQRRLKTCHNQTAFKRMFKFIEILLQNHWVCSRTLHIHGIIASRRCHLLWLVHGLTRVEA